MNTEKNIDEVKSKLNSSNGQTGLLNYKSTVRWERAQNNQEVSGLLDDQRPWYRWCAYPLLFRIQDLQGLNSWFLP